METNSTIGLNLIRQSSQNKMNILKRHIFEFHIIHYLNLKELIICLSLSKKISTLIQNYIPINNLLQVIHTLLILNR